MNELSLFAGAGGGILGGILNGWRTVCAVEINAHCQRVLMQRQDDGILEPFPIWPDITTFDGRPWAGCVDIVTGGFPCQDISVAGKGAGLDGERSGLWGEMARIIGEVRPRYVLVENSPALTIRGGTRVIGDLTALGYDTRWGVVGAHHAGAPHKRDRIWILANSNGEQLRGEQKHREECEAAPESANDGAAQSLAHADSVRELQPQRSEQDKRGRISHGGFQCDKCGWEFESGRITRFGCPQCGAEQPKIIDVANTNSTHGEKMRSAIGVQQERTNTNSRCEWWRQDPAETLNPEWVEWLMGWPINWTQSESIDIMDFLVWEILHGAPQKRPCEKAMPTLWFNNDPAAMVQWEIRLNIQEQEILLKKLRNILAIKQGPGNKQRWQEKGAEDVCPETMRDVREYKESAASHGQKPKKQFSEQYPFFMSELSRLGAHTKWRLGKREDAAKKVRNMRSGISACKSQSKIMRGEIVLYRESKEAGNGEMGRTHEGAKMRELRDGVYISESEAENVQFELRESFGMEKTKVIPRVKSAVKDSRHRLKALGNGQVPAVVRLAWKTLGGK